MENLVGLQRTCLCTQLSKADVGKTVTMMGWAQKVRDIGQLVFIDLRDRSGILQLVIEQTDLALLEKAKGVHIEYVVAAVGKVRPRAGGGINPKLPTGEIEVEVCELRILSKSDPLPMQWNEEGNVREELRLKYRYLELRRPKLQANILLRHRIAKLARDYYDQNGFIEIETPILTKSTPEGARDYLVPSRVQPGKYYALPQSPQLYKQLLMLSGFDRYMQIVKCFRDEDLRADRQPEFTQIDLEMSFVNMDDVIDVNERFMQLLFQEIHNISLPLPLPRMVYQDALEQYGSDKPDIRFDMKLINITPLVRDCGFKVFSDAAATGSVRLINAKSLAGRISRKEIDSLGEYVKTYRAKGLAWIMLSEDEIKSPIAKFLSQEQMEAILLAAGAEKGDVLFIVADKDAVVFDALGNLRCEIAKRYDFIDKSQHGLLWVTEFPLFEYDEEENRYAAKHHPFTSPMDEDIDLLETDPAAVRAKAYDIVMGGVEIGGGSIRIYDSTLQQRMFQALGFTTEDAMDKFGYLIEAFHYGTPPHGGMAYGLDRLVMLMVGEESIRDVIAFPKVQNASELMTGAPTHVDQKQLDELYLRNTLPEENQNSEEERL